MDVQAGRDRPRVLIVTPQPFYEDRGTPIAVQYVARALAEIGVDVDLLAFPIGREVKIKNVTLKRCANLLHIRRVPIGFSWKKLVLDASLWTSFSKLLALRRYDMVHAVEEAAYIAAAICPRFGQPFIYDMASAIPVELQRQPLLKSRRAQRFLRSMERWVFHRATRVVCSPGLGRYVHNQAPDAPVTEWRFPAQLPHVPRQETESLRERLQIAPDRRIVLYSGSFAGYQGIDLLFEAFVQARRSNPELLLICVGATEPEMAAWSKRTPKELVGHVRILPRQPRERIAAYIELADFLALPRGRTDNVPLKLFDYMASGKPIIAMRQAAYAPLLDQTRAFICDPTPEALAQAIGRACRSPEEAHLMGQASLRYAHRQFGWGRFVDFVRDTYSKSIFTDREGSRLSRAS
ncbi:MAG TPA: glycosyltransferase family 4 protein [Steroidobacteraceae bacterium]|jgi:glycosyltransferase involved in cell wall biosynthesis|nr:glycosyltransferase family 4 protein [Steroidobacteraceae bacterium]